MFTNISTEEVEEELKRRQEFDKSKLKPRFKGTVTVEVATGIYNKLSNLFGNREVGEIFDSNSGLKIEFCVLSINHLQDGHVEFGIESV